MATLTASLERSLRNCSLNHISTTSSGAGAGGVESAILERSSSSELAAPANLRDFSDSNSFSSSSSSSSSCSDSVLVELNSHVALPYHWEQCLDLKTGEVYYVNWANGMKSKQDPRLSSGDSCSEASRCGVGRASGYSYGYSTEEDSYESDGSSSTGDSCSTPSTPRESRARGTSSKRMPGEEEVLVVAGCKRCLMYFMFPKHLDECPKCSGRLIHFDRPERASS
ncbi:hypothetical protein Drorol1_Dr00018754 [Drosera rotundifolia]